MDMDAFERYAKNIDLFAPSEIKEFEFLTHGELEDYHRELEQSSGNLSDWDHIRALFTLKHQLWEQRDQIYELESEVRMWKSNCGEYDDEDDEMEEEV